MADYQIGNVTLYGKTSGGVVTAVQVDATGKLKIAGAKDLGWFVDLAALQAAYPTGTAGQWARVGAGATGPKIYLWDTGTSAWEEYASSSGDFTGPAGSTADDIVVFNDASGKIGKDGGAKISDLVPTSRTVNGHALTGNVDVTKVDLGINDASANFIGAAIDKINYLVGNETTDGSVRIYSDGVGMATIETRIGGVWTLWLQNPAE